MQQKGNAFRNRSVYKKGGNGLSPFVFKKYVLLNRMFSSDIFGSRYLYPFGMKGLLLLRSRIPSRCRHCFC